MNNYVILSEKKWNHPLQANLEYVLPEYNWILINKKEDFTREFLIKIKASKIFIPHWSYIIPEDIFSQFECVLFHMTDLPFGRGGSPLQNLIVRGLKETKISAIKVEKGIDTGDVYLKENLSLLGTAEEIFLRANDVIAIMIRNILIKKLEPIAQKGEPIIFKRRKPEDGDIEGLTELDQMYDHIRMLDAEGYSNAFLENENFRFEFSRASLKSDKSIVADVRIIKK